MHSAYASVIDKNDVKHLLYNMNTATLRELRHNFAAIEAAARKGPVKITRRGKVIGVFAAKREPWTPPDITSRAKAHFGERFTGLSLIDELKQGDR